MRLLQSSRFKKVTKNLHNNQKGDLDKAVKFILEDISIGIFKKGLLKSVQVYKFKMNKQLTLLAYEVDHKNNTLLLMDLGSHENFYRDLERS